MSGLDGFDEYESRVEAAVMAIPWVKTFGIYPEIPAGFDTPAVFFEIEEWADSDDTVNASQAVELTCSFYLLREFAADQWGRKAKNAALFFSNWIAGRMFGPETKPAVFVSASPATWEKAGKALSSHSIWCVTFTQVVGVGADPYAPPPNAPLLKELYIGFAPDIGPEHINDYTRIPPE